MIQLASHKTFAKKVAESQATAALFIYSDKSQTKQFFDPAVAAAGKRGCTFVAIKMNDTQPGRNRGAELPSVAGVMDVIKFFSLHHANQVVVADARGKGLAVAAAIIGRYLNHGAGRKAIEEVRHSHPDGRANAFVLRIADACLNSGLAGAVESFGKAKFVAFSPKQWADEIRQEQEARAAEQAKQAAEAKAKPVETAGKPVKAPTSPPDASQALKPASEAAKPVQPVTGDAGPVSGKK